jgi:cellulose synthase/poly-beta-1,6-N-acetylglucosamine synthase-like glycosyltransferase
VILLFITGAAVLVQAYIGYPLSLAVLRLVFGARSRHRMEESTPKVALVISAYNEAAVLRRKIENSLAIDYPRERLTIVVVSDGSEDGTASIVEEYADHGVRLAEFSGRRGKVACLNDVIPTLGSELIVMSDANSMYSADGLRRLVRHFVDPAVGCVSGRLRYVNARKLAAGDGERVYWHYEGVIKRLESELGSLLGANGAMYAYRRELFRPVDPLMFCDDVIPIRIAVAGLLALYDPWATCEEEAVSSGVEMRRRRRHASFGMRTMLLLTWEAMRAGRPFIAYQCLSHRILRWLGGPALAAILVSTPFLPDPWRWPLLSAQAAFYGAAFAGCFLQRVGIRTLPLYLPCYFLVITVAGVLGLVALIARRDKPYWDPRC